MPLEIVTVKAGGATFDAWEAVHLRASIGEAARSFRLTVAALGGLSEINAALYVYAPVDILAGDDLVARGYVDVRRASLTPTRGEIQISGRSKAQDIIDCSAVHPTGRFENASLLDVARALDQFGVGFSTEEILGTFPVVQITPGETVFGCLAPLCQAEGVTMAGQADGSVAFWKASSPKKHAGGLIEGRTFMAGDSNFDGRKRHSKHEVRGQRATGMGADDLTIAATAKDVGVTRYRPLITVMQDDIDHGKALKRARRNRDRAAGRGLTATIRVPSWRDEAGTLWTPGWKIWTESPFLDVGQDMLIEHVDYQQSGSETGGTIATLHLVDPRAYGGKKGKGSKSGAGWKMDDSDAE